MDTSFSEITWSTAKANPLRRSDGFGGFAGDGRLYVFGGYFGDADSTPSRRVDAYDPVIDKWQRRTDLPIGLSHAGIAVDGTDIYIAGGYPQQADGTGEDFATVAVWKYSVSTNKYASMPDLPAPRGGGALVLNGRTLHFFGGSDANQNDADTHWTLSLEGAAGWEDAPSLPFPRNHLAGVALDGMIYAIGGQTGHGSIALLLNRVQRYDASAGSWSNAANLPAKLSHMGSSAFVMGGRIIVAGGNRTPTKASKGVYAYRPETGAWETLSPLPRTRLGGVADDFLGNIYFTTGSLLRTTYKGVPQFILANQLPSASFSVSITDGLAPLFVSFDASDSFDPDGSIVSYSWDFGDGSPFESGLGTTHTYSMAGSFTTTLVVTDDMGGSDTSSVTIDVLASHFIESGGQVVFEAEDFLETIERGSHQWIQATKDGSVGLSMLASPNTSLTINTGFATASPEMRYVVNFQTTGTYYVWARVWGETYKDDSYHAGINGHAVGSADRISLLSGQRKQWFWLNSTLEDGSRATVPISTAGVQTFHAWMADDGFYIDRFVLTHDAGLIPSGDGPPASIFWDASNGLPRPSVTGTSPADGAVDISRDTHVAADVLLPSVGQGIDEATLTPRTVRLYPAGDSGTTISANINTSAGGDAIVLQPTSLLAANTPHIFEVTDGVKDLAGASFAPMQISFTTGSHPTGSTGSEIAFEKVVLSNVAGKHTTLAIGPDGRLYATQNDGLIKRWNVAPDGTLSDLELLDALQIAEGGFRLAIGLTFDPSARADSLVAWVSHATFGFSGMPDWGGKITRLSGAALENVQDYVVNLPRSIRDHVTNGLAFGPDGALYVCQGSNSAMGDGDSAWGNRPERKLSAAILRVDVAALQASASLPLDAKTSGGTYDPTAPGAPVKVFASGVRNAYDLVWHSNGNLYLPNNGSAANGKAPASVDGTIRLDGTPYSGPAVPAIENVETQNDFLFVVPPPSGGTWPYRYYGHPNPMRGEYVLNGGNPTELQDLAQVNRYPVGVEPDAMWQGYAFNFGRNISPNGIIEYRSSSFDGLLQGKLLVARYSGGDDIIVLTPSPDGDIASDGDETGIVGLTQFADPLELTENPSNGYLYVSEYGGAGTITLLRPAAAPGRPSPDEPLVIAEMPPDRYELQGNFPNPFNPATRIVYVLPEDSRVRLEVFDLLGRRIARLVDQVQPVGRHEALFDGGDLASGTYLYRLEAGPYSWTARMLLLK